MESVQAVSGAQWLLASTRPSLMSFRLACQATAAALKPLGSRLRRHAMAAVKPMLFRLEDPTSGGFTQYLVSGKLTASKLACLPLSNAAQVAYLLYVPAGPSGPAAPYLSSASCSCSWPEWPVGASLATLVSGCFATATEGVSSAIDMGATGRLCAAPVPGATAWGTCFAANVSGQPGGTGTVQDVASGSYWALGEGATTVPGINLKPQAEPFTWNIVASTPLFRLSTQDGQYLRANALTGGITLTRDAAQATVLEPFNGQMFLHGSVSTSFTVAPGAGILGPLAPVPSASRLVVSMKDGTPRLRVAARQPTAFLPITETYIQFGAGTAGWYPLLCTEKPFDSPTLPVVVPGTQQPLGLLYAADMLPAAPHPELMLAWLLPAFLKGGLVAPPSQPPPQPTWLSSNRDVVLAVGIPLLLLLLMAVFGYFFIP